MKENVELDLQELFKVLLKRVWVILLCAVIVGASVLVYTVNLVVPMYDASVTIYVNNKTNNDGITTNDLAVALRLVTTYINIIQSDTVLDKVIAEADLSLTSDQLRSMISAKVVDETEMFRISVTTPNPQMSANLANAIAAVAPAEIVAIIEGSSAKIIDYARVPTERSSPNYVTNTILGFFAGAVLAVVVILIQRMTETRVRNEEDLTKIGSIPVLGVIPDMTNADKVGKKVRR